MDLIGFLYGLGILHGAILAGILFFMRSEHRVANAFIAALVACIAIRFLNNWLVRNGVYINNPQWSLLSSPLDFAWGPLLYLYAYSMSGRKLGAKHVLHFIPCLLLFSAPITFALYPRDQQLEFLSYFWSNRENQELGEIVLGRMPIFWRTWMDMHLQGSFFSIQFGIYCYLVLRQVQKHRLSLERHFSFTEQMDLRWLRTLTFVCVLFLILFLVFNRGGLVLFGHFEITALSPNTPFLFLVVAIYGIGIAALYQPPIRDAQEHTPKEESTAIPEVGQAPTESAPAKYVRSSIKLEDAQRYKIRLMETMQEKKLYLDCDLTLRDLAAEAGLSYHQTSQVINGQMNQRFFSFVNNYRIGLAKELLADPKTRKMAIVDLAVEVGFKSKSSFYDAFKKVTQITPTQFKKELETLI
ncbi:MAG: helix-turn-helix transcriptional regulator [Proteobacteria bacterium]|nr:helix-turn-helix transcriptional regulator [Pseudomonadota bacterium]